MLLVAPRVEKRERLGAERGAVFGVRALQVGDARAHGRRRLRPAAQRRQRRVELARPLERVPPQPARHGVVQHAGGAVRQGVLGGPLRRVREAESGDVLGRERLVDRRERPGGAEERRQQTLQRIEEERREAEETLVTTAGRLRLWWRGLLRTLSGTPSAPSKEEAPPHNELP